MRLNTTFGLLALGALLAASITPVLARDTRTETDRPRIEIGGDSDSDSDSEVKTKPRLPKSSDGLRCVVKDHNGYYVQVVNGSEWAYGPGTIVTVYVQPGNVQKSFTLESYWFPGKPLNVPMKGVDLSAGSECSVKVKLPKTEIHTATPDEMKFECIGPYEPWYPDALNIKNDTPYWIPGGTTLKITLMPGPVEVFYTIQVGMNVYGGAVIDDALLGFPDGYDSCAIEVVQ